MKLYFLLITIIIYTQGCINSSTNKNNAANNKCETNEVAAIINSDTIFLKDVDHIISNELFEMRKKALFDEITHRILLLEANQQNLSVEELIQKEIAGKMEEVTNNDVLNYMRNGYNYKGSLDLNSELYKRSRTALEDENFKIRQNEYLKTLANNGTSIRILLKNNELNKTLNLDSIECFSKGNKTSGIRVVVVSDYMCEACKDASDQMEKLFLKYGNRIEFYSILFTDNISNAELAAMAAGEQGKFWEMHKLIFSNQQNLSDKIFFEFAKNLNLNIDKFKSDIGSKEIRYIAERNIRILKANEIVSVPVIIINGKQMPKDYRIEHIEAILKRMLK